MVFIGLIKDESVMKPDNSPIETKALKLCTVGEFLAVLASDAMLPGAGAAGGIALALAAACAGKAVAITRRHDVRSALLANLQMQLTRIAEQALVLAQTDAIQFKQQLVSGDPAASDALLHTGHTILEACRTLDRILCDNEHHIADNMAGDWKAARALSDACLCIHQENVRELKSET